MLSCKSGQGSHRDGVIRNTTRLEPRVIRSGLNVSSCLRSAHFTGRICSGSAVGHGTNLGTFNMILEEKSERA